MKTIKENKIFNKNILKQMIINKIHLGHIHNKWNPKMKKYIFCKKKSGVHIIDLLQTIYNLKKVCNFLENSTFNNKNFDLKKIKK